jgi:hypothetical protein
MKLELKMILEMRMIIEMIKNMKKKTDLKNIEKGLKRKREKLEKKYLGGKWHSAMLSIEGIPIKKLETLDR